MVHSRSSAERQFVFDPTPAVTESRSRRRYVSCSLCKTDQASYLFHRVGVRFVRCRNCGLVYVNPAGDRTINYFDIERVADFVTPSDRRMCVRDFDDFLREIEQRYRSVHAEPLCRVALLGRYLPEFAELPSARRVGLSFCEVSDATFAALALESSVDWARHPLDAQPQVVVLHELLEACSDPAEVMRRLAGMLGQSTWIVVTYSDVESLPARMMRRYWPLFFEVKNVFFNTSNLTALMAKSGYGMSGQFAYPTRRTAGYVLRRLSPHGRATRAVLRTPVGQVPAPLRTGQRAAVFRRKAEAGAVEKLSIILPAYDEERYIASVVEAVLNKPLRIEKELIIVESNSRDRTREIVQTFAERREVKVILEDRPRGKGHAVRTGLKAATGSIILIQDADFEYDIDDYDALLEPILQRRTQFVLGSRSLGLDDWKVRKYASTPLKGLFMNLAQVGFARTFNLLYQQRVTDVNTMFKVFRRDCLDRIELTGDGFDLDIELVCKLVRAGYAPLEVPVNYVSRGFEEGKKIDFWRDAFPSYAAFFRYRFR